MARDRQGYTCVGWLRACEMGKLTCRASTDTLGSPKAVWDNLNVINGVVPLAGNHPLGTMLTMKSARRASPPFLF